MKTRRVDDDDDVVEDFCDASVVFSVVGWPASVCAVERILRDDEKEEEEKC